MRTAARVLGFGLSTASTPASWLRALAPALALALALAEPAQHPLALGLAAGARSLWRRPLWLACCGDVRRLVASAMTCWDFPSAAPRPDADLDATTSTDLEDLLNFAADLFEFVHQEYALLVASFGEAGLVGAAALGGGLLVLSRVVSSRRLK